MIYSFRHPISIAKREEAARPKTIKAIKPQFNPPRLLTDTCDGIHPRFTRHYMRRGLIQDPEHKGLCGEIALPTPPHEPVLMGMPEKLDNSWRSTWCDGPEVAFTALDKTNVSKLGQLIKNACDKAQLERTKL